MGNSIYLKMLKQEKQYRFVILANIISRFGDSIDSIAYSWLVYGLTNSKSWLAITVGVNMIPTILFHPFGGALALIGVYFLKLHLGGSQSSKRRGDAARKIPFKIPKYIQSMKEGSKFFFKKDIAVMVCLVCIVLNIIGIPVINMQIAYVSEYLKLGLTAVSLGSVVKTLGAVIGALSLPG